MEWSQIISEQLKAAMKIKKLQQTAISFDDCTTLKENYDRHASSNDGKEIKELQVLRILRWA